MLSGDVAIQKIRKGSDGEQRQHEQIAQIKGEGGKRELFMQDICMLRKQLQDHDHRNQQAPHHR